MQYILTEKRTNNLHNYELLAKLAFDVSGVSFRSQMQLMQCQLPRHSLPLDAAVLANIICIPLSALSMCPVPTEHTLDPDLATSAVREWLSTNQTMPFVMFIAALCTQDCKSCFFLMFLFIHCVAARIYKNLRCDLSRCYVDRTGGRIASYRRLTPSTSIATSKQIMSYHPMSTHARTQMVHRSNTHNMLHHVKCANMLDIGQFIATATHIP